jgi:hypothetical protein
MSPASLMSGRRAHANKDDMSNVDERVAGFSLLLLHFIHCTILQHLKQTKSTHSNYIKQADK